MKITVEKAPPSLAQEVVEEEGAIDLTKDVKFEEIKLGNKEGLTFWLLEFFESFVMIFGKIEVSRNTVVNL